MTTHLFRLFKKFLIGFLGAVLIGLGISQFSASNADVTFYYAITDLGTLGSDPFAFPVAINNAGQVVGFTRSSSGRFPGPPRSGNHTFLWQNGTITDLGTLGGSYSYAWGINDAGTVVGEAATSGADHAFVYKNSQMSDLNNFLPANSGWELLGAVDINDNGQIVAIGLFNGQKRGVLLTPITVVN